jgi:hypothetical protein
VADLGQFLGIDPRNVPGGAGGLDTLLLRLVKQRDDPVPRFAFQRRAAQVAVGFRKAVKRIEDEADEAVQEALRRDWNGIAMQDRDAAIERAVAPIERVASRSRKELLADLEAEGLRMERQTRRSSKRKFQFDIPTVMTGALVLSALRRSASPLGFIEDEYVRRANVARDAARAAITAGVAAGKSSRDVSRDAATAARGAIRNDDYWRDVSMATLNRSRTAALITSYADAGVSGYHVRAQPDACDKCRFIESSSLRTPFSVRRGAEVLSRATEARTPQEVRRASPFLGEGVDASGRRAVFVGSGETRRAIAVVRGDGFESADSPEELSRAGIMLPPFHPRCKCVPVPA